MNSKIFCKPSYKGCSFFYFYNTSSTLSTIGQLSGNPAVYTKLSCYLPWVAAQYDMDYSPPGDPDPACLTGQGDITEVTAKVCRSNPLNSWADTRDGIEAPCLFPFTLNGRDQPKFGKWPDEPNLYVLNRSRTEYRTVN